MVLQMRLHFLRQLNLQLQQYNAVRGVCTTSALQRRIFFGNDAMHVVKHARPSRMVVNKQVRNVSSSSTQAEYRLEPSGLQLESFHARDIYKEAVNSVEPRHMVENVLQFNQKNAVLVVNDTSYKLDHNVYVVGFGKAVLGMARAAEDILGEHVVSGILSIPQGQREVLKEKEKGDLLLLPESKIQVYEGGHSHLPDHGAYQAALAIEKLLTYRKETDLIIVLISGGGSPLLPCPQDPITLDDLIVMTKVLVNHGAPFKVLNVIRKNVERLKGGKLADTAHPAKMVSLIISDMIGDPINVIASGPTVPDQANAHQCFEILDRFHVREKMPDSIINHLQRQMLEEASRVKYKRPADIRSLNFDHHEVKKLYTDRVQNVVVGSNAIACQAAFVRARELGHLPYILTTKIEGEARDTGAMLGKLGMFMLMCFDRKVSTHLNMLKLELDIIKDGVTKQQINEIVTLVNTAANMGRNAVIISGGESVVSIKGDGTGGRNMELAVGASVQLQQLFNLSQPRPSASITLLSADTDGEDGPNSFAAGAVINENFAIEAQLGGYSCEDFLNRNDTHSLFKSVKGGSHLVVTRTTGTNVMDIQVLIVRNPLTYLK